MPDTISHDLAKASVQPTHQMAHASTNCPPETYLAAWPGGGDTYETKRHADKHFRRMRAALNASESGLVGRMCAGWRVRWQVHRLRFRLRQLGVHDGDLPPPRKMFVREKVPLKITDVAWHEQLRLWWWPRKLSPDIHP